MENYLGIIIEQCLKDAAVVSRFPIVSVRRGKAWTFLLASVPEQSLAEHVRLLQQHMVTDDNWYAHYFRGNDLVVVYRDAVFPVTTDPASWGEAVAHGLAAGIPLEQLDFTPRTQAGIEAFFGTRL